MEQWVARYHGPFIYSPDYAIGIAVDDLGNVYVTGSSWGSFPYPYSGNDYVTIKYSNTGVEQWVARYREPGNSDDVAVALGLDNSRNVYVTGSSPNPSGRNSVNFVTVKYNDLGGEEWVTRYQTRKFTDDVPVGLAADRSGNVHVAGTSSYFPWSIYTTIKYVQTPVWVKDKEPKTPTEYRLAQNYPNPFNPFTTMRYAIAKPGPVTLKVFNLAGQEIATLVNENKMAGEYEVQWSPANLPSGVYVYRLQAGVCRDQEASLAEIEFVAEVVAMA